MPPTHEADEAPRTPNRQPVRPSSYQRRGRKAERKLSKEKEKNRFLTTRVDYAARSTSYNGGQQQERGTVVMDKGVSLSRTFSVWCRLKGGEANSWRRSVGEQKVDKNGNISFPLPFFFISSLRSLALSVFPPRSVR